MARLAEHQQVFAHALLERDVPDPPGLVGPDGAPDAARFAVYRNNVFTGLIDALRTSFPCVQKLVGDDFFIAMARAFVVHHPPASPVLLHYGAAFAAFIESFGPAAGLPYLPDVARLERAATEAYHAPEATSLDAAALAAITPGQAPALRLRLHPSLRLLASRFPVVTIWQMNAEGGEPAPLDFGTGEQALVLRADAEVEIRRVAGSSLEFIRALDEGHVLAEATGRALAIDTGFDLAENLLALVQAGAVIAIEAGAE